MAQKSLELRSDIADWWPELFPRRLLEWFDWPATSGIRHGEKMLRVEEYLDGDDLVVRAEMAGIDPEKDVNIELRDHELEIRAERREEKTTEDKGYRRSEFSYGSFVRVVRMPENAKESDVHATYQDGILEVRVPLEHTPEVQPKAIPVERKE